MLNAIHHPAGPRRPGRLHITLENWLLTATSLFFTVLMVLILFLIVFVSRAT